jgi:hypothetical protein
VHSATADRHLLAMSSRQLPCDILLAMMFDYVFNNSLHTPTRNCVTCYGFLVQANRKDIAPPVQRIVGGKGDICPTVWPQRHLHTHVVGYRAQTSVGWRTISDHVCNPTQKCTGGPLC